MKSIRYFIQFLLILFFFLIFKILGVNYASFFSGKIMSIIGPYFRSKALIKSNILRAIPNLKDGEIKKIVREMWNNYGRILAEYVFIKDFRNSKLKENIEINGQEILKKIKENNEPVIFISGHFNNFELMAMQIEKSEINLATVYRPLNNKTTPFIF